MPTEFMCLHMYECMIVNSLLISHATGKHHAILKAAFKANNDL